MPFKSFATLGTVPPNAENGTAMKPTDSLTKCPYWRIFRFFFSASPIREEQFLCRLAFWVVQRLERLQCAAWPIVVHQVTRADCISACLHVVVCHFY